MFSPIKKIFTYIQKNASGSNMFSPSGNTTAGQREEAPSLRAHDEGDRKEQDQDPEQEDDQSDQEQQQQPLHILPQLNDDEDDIERQIKTESCGCSWSGNTAAKVGPQNSANQY